MTFGVLKGKKKWLKENKANNQGLPSDRASALSAGKPLSPSFAGILVFDSQSFCLLFCLKTLYEISFSPLVNVSLVLLESMASVEAVTLVVTEQSLRLNLPRAPFEAREWLPVQRFPLQPLGFGHCHHFCCPVSPASHQTRYAGGHAHSVLHLPASTHQKLRSLRGVAPGNGSQWPIMMVFPRLYKSTPDHSCGVRDLVSPKCEWGQVCFSMWPLPDSHEALPRPVWWKQNEPPTWGPGRI